MPDSSVLSKTFLIFASQMQYNACMDLSIIKQRRVLLGITQQDLADFSGVGLRTIRQIESGESNPSIETLSKILDVVGMEIVFNIKNLDKIADI